MGHEGYRGADRRGGAETRQARTLQEAAVRMTLDNILVWAAVAFGFLAAGLWFKSTMIRVPPDPESNDFQIIDKSGAKHYDVLETAKRQVSWNRFAALATAIAVLCHATSMLLRQIS